MEVPEEVFKRYGLKTVQLKEGLYAVHNWKDVIICANKFCYEFEKCVVFLVNSTYDRSDTYGNIVTIWLNTIDWDVQFKIFDKLGIDRNNALCLSGFDKESAHRMNTPAIDSIELTREVAYYG